MAQGSARIGKDRYRTEIDVGGHALIADEPPALGGGGVGPAPYDLKGWPLESVEVGLRLSGREEKRIDRSLAIVGLDDEQRARMADIAERTPVTLTLKAGLPITTTLA